MLGKLLFFITIINLSLGVNMEIPRSDMVILESGEKIKGHIQYIYDGVIIIKTDHGEKKIVRDVNVNSPRDIVETGILKNKRHSGCVKFFGDDVIEIKTMSGIQVVKRALVRKIIISHDLPSDPVNL